MIPTFQLADAKHDTHTRRTLSEISLAVAKSKKIIVVTGAGISCSSGIPDFRSSDGLYNLVKKQYPGVVLKGRDLFDASLFRDSTSTAVFYTFISQLKKSIDSATPTPTHHFIKTLDTKNKLVRSYTQNIDGLEDKVGLLSSSSQDARTKAKGKAKLHSKNVRNVQLHGDIHRVRCQTCSAEYPCAPDHLEYFTTGSCPNCPECLERSKARIARSARATKVGTLRPAIVLYDEPHPLGDDIGMIQTTDIGRKPDLLIVMGTSLKVHGLKKLVKDFAKAIHANGKGKVIFVNRTSPSSEWSGVIDYHVAGDTDSWVERVVEDWKRMKPADWQIQQTLTEGNLFKTVKAKSTKDVKAKPPAIEDEEEENIPPSVDRSMITPPSSPSKRRKSSSHYNMESSPSKKKRQPMVSYNNSVDMEMDQLALDLSMHDVNSPLKKKTSSRSFGRTRSSGSVLDRPKRIADDVFL